MINVLSLFDGMACGRIALERAGVKVGKYYASELDKYAITVAQANWPENIQLGDVTRWREWGLDWDSIDLVTGGFPCQAWSMAGNQLGDKDERGMLFWTMLDIMKHVKYRNPNANFLIENVKMKKEFEQYITTHTENALGKVHKILINSALVSAQNRNRYYWTSFKVDQPEDKGIYFTSAHCTGRNPRTVIRTKGNKTNCITASYFKGLDADSRPGVCGVEGLGLDYHSAKKEGFRMLTPRECFRLQTVPEHYIDKTLACGVSDSQLYKIAGNGWTVSVIAHIFESLKRNSQ